MTPPNDDRSGVFVPRWAMRDVGGDARDAMVLAQITWWLQPAQRDGRRRTQCTVERDGVLWLYLTDGELGEDIGMSRDQVGRARRKLAKLALIETRSSQVDGRKVTLTRSTIESAEVHDRVDEQCDPALSIVQVRTDPCAEVHDRPLIETEETNREETSTLVDVDSSIEALCRHLAQCIEQHRGGNRPVITARWRTAMRLLIERGPLHVDDPTPQSPEKVRASIDAVFGTLNVPDARGGFCWADQIRSAAALRDHWVQLAEAYKRTTGGRIGRGAQAVDRVARRLGADAADSQSSLGLIVEHEPKEITA